MGATFFARDVKGAQAFALQSVQGLQQQGGFANAGVAANQHHAALHNAPAQGAVEFVQARGGAVNVGGLDVFELDQS